jgi:GTP-binding protein Era
VSKDELKKAGYVGVVGLPNVGKSTLVNHLTRAKVCITSNKPQTTRKNIMGVLTKENSQFIFVDSPGFIQAENGLNSFLESEWKKVIEDVDTLVFVFSVDSKKESFQRTLDLMDSIEKNKIAVITKTDLGFPEREMIIEGEMRSRGVKCFKAKRKGKTENLQVSEGLIDCLSEKLPVVDNFYYDSEIYTTQSLRDLSTEIILENVFRYLSDELPYETGVQIVDFKELPHIFKIYGEIIVSRERYKKIIVGHNGETIKRIGTLSRKSLESEFGTKVFLDLRVKCKEAWNKKPGALKELGYAEKR